MNTKTIWLITVLVAIAALLLGYSLGSGNVQKTAYDAGYQKAVSDTRASQQAAADRALAEAARAANPFQVTNPLEGVEPNPFERAKKALNPFE